MQQAVAHGTQEKGRYGIDKSLFLPSNHDFLQSVVSPYIPDGEVLHGQQKLSQFCVFLQSMGRSSKHSNSLWPCFMCLLAPLCLDALVLYLPNKASSFKCFFSKALFSRGPRLRHCHRINISTTHENSWYLFQTHESADKIYLVLYSSEYVLQKIVA